MEDRYFAQLMYGNVETLVLSVLAGGPLHGYGIRGHLREHSDGYVVLSEGRLYPLLRRMERDGLVRSRLTRSVTRREVREYRLTAAGTRDLEARLRAWRTFSRHMGVLLTPPA